MQETLQTLALSAIAGSATLVGLALIVYAQNWVKKYSSWVVSMAAGIILGTTFFHLLPEGMHLLGEEVFFWLLLGFVAFFILEALIGFHVCQEEPEIHDHAHGEAHHHDHHHHILGSVAGLGLLIHSFVDGLAIAIGFEISPEIGLATAIAVLVHELPEGIFTFAILMHAKYETKKAIWASVAVALATPLGTALGLIFLPNLSEKGMAIALALTAGSFLYVGASDLIPESHKSRSLKSALWTLLGLALSYTIFISTHLGHAHHEEEHELDAGHFELLEEEIHEEEHADEHAH